MVLIGGLPRSGTTWMSRMLSILLDGEFLFEPFAGLQRSCIWGDSKKGGIPNRTKDRIINFNQHWYVRVGTPPPEALGELTMGVEEYMSKRPQAVGVKEVYHTASIAHALNADSVIYITRHPAAMAQSALSIKEHWHSTQVKIAKQEMEDEWNSIIPTPPDSSLRYNTVAELCTLFVMTRHYDMIAMQELEVGCQIVSFEYTTANPAYSWPIIAGYLGVDIPADFEPTPPPLTGGKHITENRESPLQGTWRNESADARTCYNIGEAAMNNARELWGGHWDSVESNITVGR